MLARPEPVLRVAHEELREEHSAGSGHVGGEEEGDLARVDAEYASLELLLVVCTRAPRDDMWRDNSLVMSEGTVRAGTYYAAQVTMLHQLLTRSSCLSLEKKGGPPVTISKMSTPYDQKSAASSWPFLRITSGAMQKSVP